MEIHLKIIGILLIILSFIHIIFPTYFNWKEELQRLSLVNKQMMVIHTIFIALMVCLMGMLCLTSSEELVDSSLGRTISLGLAIFWSMRLLLQFIGYSPKLWKGKPFETIIHILFSGLWTYMSIVFWSIYFLA